MTISEIKSSNIFFIDLNQKKLFKTFSSISDKAKEKEEEDKQMNVPVYQ